MGRRIGENGSVYICPKCATLGFDTKNISVNCRFCNTPLIETDMSFADYGDYKADGTVEIRTRKLFERYVKDNLLYDPDEAELSQAKFDKAKRDSEQAEANRRAAEAAKPKCPTCQSTNIEKIGAIKKGLSIGILGLMSSDLGKTMQCNDCGYKW